jgi:hypothetical protein
MIPVLALVMLSQTPVCADKQLGPGFELHHLPMGQFCALDDGTSRICYDLDTFKKLLITDREFSTAVEKARTAEKIIETQGQIIQQKDITIKAYEADVRIYEDQVKRLDENWKQCMEEQAQLDIGVVVVSTGVGLIVGAAIGVTTAFLVGTAL